MDRLSTKGGRHHREHGHHLEQAAHELPHADVHLHIGKQQAHQGGQDAHQEPHLQGVGDGRGKGGHGENAPEGGQAEAAVAHKTIHQQNGQRVEDKQGQKCDQHDDGGDHDGVRHELLPVQRRALCSCHRESPFPSLPKKGMLQKIWNPGGKTKIRRGGGRGRRLAVMSRNQLWGTKPITRS